MPTSKAIGCGGRAFARNPGHAALCDDVWFFRISDFTTMKPVVNNSDKNRLVVDRKWAFYCTKSFETSPILYGLPAHPFPAQNARYTGKPLYRISSFKNTRNVKLMCTTRPERFLSCVCERVFRYVRLHGYSTVFCRT